MDSIVAVDTLWAIGKKQDLLFKVPEDLAYLKKMTMGKQIIFGRKTFQSLPGGRPLPGRENIVLTQDRNFDAEGITVCHSLGQLAKILQPEKEPMVLGGSKIYKVLLPYCQRAYVTKFQAAGDGDTFFPNLDNDGNWELESTSEEKEHEGLKFTFCVYKNKAPLSFETLNEK